MVLQIHPPRAPGAQEAAEPTEARAADRAASGSYSELKGLIKAHGLLDRQPSHFVARLVIVMSLLALSVALLVTVRVFWVLCLDAVFMGLVSTQLGFNGHDVGHRQAFTKTWTNDLVGLLQGTLLLGMSFSWWLDKHNRHHSNPNVTDCDPDIDLPLLAFTTQQADQKRGFARFITAHQVWFFFPLLTLVALELQMNGVKFLVQGKARYPKTEAFLLLVHFVGYFGLLFALLPVWQAVVFILIHQAVTGLYLGSVFAPNHKGMPVLTRGDPLDFLRRQTLTARNVHANPLTDFWYGGLNYQIEHHLFPTMPRGRLAHAQPIIRAYCEQHGVSYHETGIFQSYREILTSLHVVGASLRLPNQ
ncbi:MAG TPA: acyl-CoA desaturase [Ktedonobacterales bacterium]|nr:acyl-CoA desaturase [Ktedonobacterales bacterium]